MKLLIKLFLIFVLPYLTAFAQKLDPNEVSILEKILDQRSFEIHFIYKYHLDGSTSPAIVESCSAIILNNMYKISNSREVIISNAKTVYTFNHENEELYIEKYSADKACLWVLLKHYKHAYKISNIAYNNNYIDYTLNSIDTDDDVISIIISVDKKNLTLTKIQLTLANNDIHLFEILIFKKNPSLKASFFSHKQDLYSHYKTIDLT